jgi:hypothetical protein
VETAVIHFSSMARSLPPHRGAVFKQRPKHNKRLCLFRAQVEKMAKKEIPAAKTYKLSWGCPRWTGGMVKVSFSFKTAPVSANSPGCPTPATAHPALPTAITTMEGRRGGLSLTAARTF